MKILIRKAGEEDLNVINDLTDEVHRYLAGLYGLELSRWELEKEHFEVEELENVHVAEDIEAGVVGYLSFSKRVDEWAGPHYELEHLVIHEGYRGLSVGKKLFEVLLEKARREAVNITTGTLAKNERALRFYEELGFKWLSIGLLLDLQKRILKCFSNEIIQIPLGVDALVFFLAS